MTVFTHNPSGFLNMTRTIYPQAQHTRQHVSLHSFRHADKLKGEHEWPFSFILPKGVSILTHIFSDAVRKKFRLPPSVDDDANRVYIQYQLEVRVVRSGFRGSSKYVHSAKVLDVLVNQSSIDLSCRFNSCQCFVLMRHQSHDNSHTRQIARC